MTVALYECSPYSLTLPRFVCTSQRDCSKICRRLVAKYLETVQGSVQERADCISGVFRNSVENPCIPLHYGIPVFQREKPVRKILTRNAYDANNWLTCRQLSQTINECFAVYYTSPNRISNFVYVLTTEYWRVQKKIIPNKFWQICRTQFHRMAICFKVTRCRTYAKLLVDEPDVRSGASQSARTSNPARQVSKNYIHFVLFQPQHCLRRCRETSGREAHLTDTVFVRQSVRDVNPWFWPWP